MIYGNVIGMNSHRADWDQADPTQPDFIKNKPDVVSQEYVDSKHLSGSVVLSSANWVGGVLTVTVSGILSTDAPHYGPVYSGDREAEKEAFALIDELETSTGTFIFRCFGDVPDVDLTVQWEVNR